MSEAVKGFGGTFCVGALAGREGGSGDGVVWKSGLVTNIVVVVLGRLVVVGRGRGLLRGGPNFFSSAATSGGIFGCGGGPRLAKDGRPLGFLGLST